MKETQRAKELEFCLRFQIVGKRNPPSYQIKKISLIKVFFANFSNKEKNYTFNLKIHIGMNFCKTLFMRDYLFWAYLCIPVLSLILEPVHMFCL